MPTRTRIGVLGRTTLASGTSEVPLSPAQRRLLAVLVLRGPAGATPQRLVEAVWGEQPPPSARASLHNQLARLRRQLPPGAVAWDDRRYRLEPGDVEVDVLRFARACAEAGVATEAGDPATVLRRADEALALWRGEPFEDVEVLGGDLERERLRLEELHAEVEDARAEALLETGQLPAAIAALQELVRIAPHRERRWGALMVALARAGRRADALEAYDAAHRYFVGELGLEPPPTLVDVHRRVLRDEVRDPGSATPREGHAHQPVVGRAEVVAELARHLDGAGDVVLVGEGGLGKSAVVAELVRARRRAGLATVLTTCASNPWSALQPIVDLLEQLRPDLETLDPPIGTSVRQLLGRGRVGTAVTALGPDPGVLHEEVADALDRVARARGGLTLVLDDAHRGGPTTHRLLRAAVERSPGVQLLAVTRRTAELPPGVTDGATTVALEPLGLDAIARLAHHHLDTGVDASAFVAWLAQLTRGNALFVTAVLEDLQRRGVLSAGPDGRVRVPERLEVPERLQEAVALVIGALGLPARRALDVAAVLDDPIEERAFRALADPADLAESVTAGILRRTSPTTWAFRHELVRRVAYDAVPTGRRVELHHAVAAVGRDLGVAAPQVAAHALAAAPLDPGGAIRSAREAAEAALAALAYEEAVAWFDRATEAARTAGLPADDLELLHLEVEAADAQRLAGVAGHAERLLDAGERAVRCDDPDLRLRAVLAALRLGETGEPGPSQRRAAALAEEALAREPRSADRAAIAASASLVHSLSGEPERCRELFADAYGSLEDDDPVTAVQVLPYAYMGLAHADDLELREQAAERLCAAAELLDDPVGLWEGNHLTFTVALQRGDGRRLRAADATMRRLRDRVGDAGRRWSTAYQAAALEHLAGRLDRAEEVAGEALAIGVGVAASRALAAYAGQLLELRRQAGRLDELVPVIEQLLDEQEQLPAWRAAASLVLAASSPDRSAALFDGLAGGDGSFAPLPRDFAWLASMMALTRGAVVRGDADGARTSARSLEPYADRVSWQGTCTYGPVALVLAEVAALDGDREAVERCARTAMLLAERLGAPRYHDEALAVLERAT